MVECFQYYKRWKTEGKINICILAVQVRQITVLPQPTHGKCNSYLGVLPQSNCAQLLCSLFLSFETESFPLVHTRLSPNIRSSSFSLLNDGHSVYHCTQQLPCALKLHKKSWLPMQNNDSIHIWKSENFYWNYELIQIFWKATCIKTLMLFLWTRKTSLKDLS